MKKAALLAPLMLALMVASCSWLPDSSLEYRKAAVTDPIKVPEGGVFIGEQPLYAVPRQDERLTAPREDEDRFQPPRPPQLVVLGNAPDKENDEPAPEGESAKALLGRDGNGYPIIMMSTRYAWAWEYVGDALKQTDLKVSDRDREVGIFYLKVPDRKSTRLNSSH